MYLNFSEKKNQWNIMNIKSGYRKTKAQNERHGKFVLMSSLMQRPHFRRTPKKLWAFRKGQQQIIVIYRVCDETAVAFYTVGYTSRNVSQSLYMTNFFYDTATKNVQVIWYETDLGYSILLKKLSVYWGKQERNETKREW